MNKEPKLRFKASVEVTFGIEDDFHKVADKIGNFMEKNYSCKPIKIDPEEVYLINHIREWMFELKGWRLYLVCSGIFVKLNDKTIAIEYKAKYESTESTMLEFDQNQIYQQMMYLYDYITRWSK